MATKTARSSFDTVRKLALALPGVEEYICYGTPALRVRKQLLARLREDHDTLVVKCEDSRRELLMQVDPATYFMEPHYHGYPVVLVRLSRVRADALARLLEDAWRMLAGKRLLAQRQQSGS
ncbi:MAG TPA: MmcQ/YjbR family DNA-binding protein [Nevskia sp.]|jgi:hypothetical protein|nr:MmcQ/YjbR family DNA-binding protein [Nevskia sp.]